MSQFSTRDRRTLREMLHPLPRPVEVWAFAGPDSPTDATNWLYELAEITAGRIGVTVFSDEAALASTLGVVARPSFRVVGAGGEVAPLDIVGIPTGYQFGAFVQLVMALAKNKSQLPHNRSSAVKNVPQDTVMEIWVTPTCPHSPQLVRLAEDYALANPARLFVRVIDAIQYAEMVPEGVEAVPHLRLFQDGELVGERTGMTPAGDLWRMIQRGRKGDGKQ